MNPAAGAPPRVLVTGGSGSVGSAVCAGLPAAGWTVRQIDLRPPASEPQGPGESVVGDVFDPATLRRAVDGCTAVVHLAAIPCEAPIADIAASHVVGTALVLEAARRAGIERFVFASSNHAAGFTPRGDFSGGNTVGTDVRPRPDTFYGVGKVAGEALCSLYADRYAMRTACVRIGTFRERPVTRRHLSTWLSSGDLVRMVDACLRAPDLSYAVVWGISANTRRWWDLAPGQALGYQPQDDAEAYAAMIGPVEPADGGGAAAEDDPADPDFAYLGGAFTQPPLPQPVWDGPGGGR
jgi:uronate dehydrogenase